MVIQHDRIAGGIRAVWNGEARPERTGVYDVQIILVGQSFKVCRVPEEFIYPGTRKILIAIAVFALIVPSTIADNFPASGPVASCKVARLHSGQAAAPKKAPLSVKRAIWAANQLRSKPYRYGGGHKSFDDRGYDCSGTISYVLGAAGITVYACEGHTFAVIAGLRLDTTPWDNSSNRWAPRWQTTERLPRGFEARHPTGL